MRLDPRAGARPKGMLFKWGSGTGTNFSTAAKLVEGVSSRAAALASGPVSLHAWLRRLRRRDQVAVARPAERRRWSSSTSDHPDVVEYHLVQGATRRSKAWASDRRRLRRLVQRRGLQRRSSSRTPTTAIRATDDVHEARCSRGQHSGTPAGPHQMVSDGRDGTRRRDIMRADRRGDVGQCGDPWDAVRHHRQQLAHLPEHGADQRFQPVLGVHVPRRQRLQPRQPQPSEIPEAEDGRKLRRSRLSSRAVRT